MTGVQTCALPISITERYDELIQNILGIDGTVSNIMDIYTDAYINTHFEYIDNILIGHIMNELSKMDMDLSAENAIYQLDSETVSDVIFELFDEYELDWYDHNIENFGITDKKKVIMLDNGLQSYDDLLRNKSGCDTVTYRTLISA